MDTSDVVISNLCSSVDECNDKAIEGDMGLRIIRSSRNIRCISNENSNANKDPNNSKLHLSRSGDASVASTFQNMIKKY